MVKNTYDAVYNLTKVSDPENGDYAYTYDAANRPTKLVYPNSWVEEYSYDAEGNLLKTVDTDPFQLFNKTPKTKFEYHYDAEGNVTWEYKRDTDAVEGLTSETNYTYDALNRLASSSRTTRGYLGTEKHTYTYDTLGNLVRDAGPKQQDVDTFQYNNLNQMTGKEECGYVQSVTRVHDYAFTYDGRGNLVKEEEICAPTTQGQQNITAATYKYDETNRMVQSVNEEGEASLYTFNGLGVRVGTELILKDNAHGYTDFHCQTPSIETDLTTPEVVKSDYVIDYTRLDVDQRLLLEHEEDGYDFRYVYGNDLVNTKVTGEGTNWWGQSIKECIYSDYVHTNHLGSVVNLSDEFGRVPARADYSDWGEVTAYDTITVDGGYRILMPEATYAGHQYDDVLDLFYAKARFYDAENKRFVAVDPVKNGFNWYTYCGNQPLVFIDPLGLLELKADDYVTIYHPTLFGGGFTEITYRYKDALSNLQHWLVYLGYIDEADVSNVYGQNYGGKTIAAVKLFQLNYGITPTTSANDYTYLAIANATLLKKYSSEAVRQREYKKIVNSVKLWDNNTKSYYRAYTCAMKQEIKSSALSKMPDSVTVKKIGNINYLDYTTVINTTLAQNIQDFFNHRLEFSYDQYIEKFSTKNHIPNLEGYLGYIASDTLWFEQQVESGARWDLKLENRWNEMFNYQITYYSQAFKFIYEGKIITSEDLGNITFGYLGSAMGFSSNTLHAGALFAGHDKENQQDTDMVNWGISKFFKEYGDKYPVLF